MRTAVVVLGVTMLVAGCASSAVHGARSTSTPALGLACPLVTPHATTTGRLPADPIAAIACITNEPPQKRLPGRPLRADLAQALARLVDRAPLAPAPVAVRCAPSADEADAVIRFGYPGGQVADLAQPAPDCGDGIVLVGATAYQLTKAVGLFIFGLTAPVLGNERDAPDVIGLPLGTARSRMRSAHRSLQVDGTYLDPGSAPGTVLLANDADGDQTDVIVAVRPSPPCRPSQLALAYQPGHAGSGVGFGAIEVRDTSAQWCELRGPIRVVGVDATGHAVTDTSAATVPADLELSPSADGLTTEIDLTAGYRDDSTAPDAMCEPHWIVPATWRLELPGGTLQVPNGHGRVGRPPGADGLITCRGRFGAIVARPDA